jgi:hypothetical protein
MKITGTSEWLVNNNEELIAELMRMREERRAAREAKAAK